MKKALELLLCATMLMGLLAGCGGSTEQSTRRLRRRGRERRVREGCLFDPLPGCSLLAVCALWY